jgi:lipoyl(octanoyl) transferase
MALPVLVKDLGVMGYQQAWDYQEVLMQENLAIKQQMRTAEIEKTFYEGADTQSHFLFVDHPHVYSLGKSGSMDNLLATPEFLSDNKIEFYKTNRGGDITYHGPGQIVAYPIFDLEKIKPDIVWYMRMLEEAVIRTLAEFGIIGERLPGETGVWLEPAHKDKARKICALGVRTSRWITMHGLALNVNTDLKYFDYIVPCGITDKGVTSMTKELNQEVNMTLVKEKLLGHMQQIFGLELLNG